MKKRAVEIRWSLATIAGAVFAFALLLRLIYVYQWFQMPYGAAPYMDAQANNNWAQWIAQGHIAHGLAFYLSPMLPYLLGLLYAIFGTSLWIPSVLNALLGAATCALLARLAFKAFGPIAAVTAGMLAAAYRPFIFYTPPVMKETLALFLLALFLNFAHEAMRKISFRNLLGSGLALGFCAIVRGNVLFFIPVVLAYICWAERKERRWKDCGIFLLGVGIAILPITLHNAIASHDFVLLSYSDGFNSYLGHNDGSTGTSYSFPPDITSAPEKEEFDITRSAQNAVGHKLKPSEVSNYWRNKAVAYAFTHVGREFRLLGRKIRAFWNNAEPFDNYDMDFIEANFDTLMSWPLVNFSVMVFMAVFAAVALRKTREREIAFFGGFTLLYMLTLLPFYVTDRYRLPAVIFFLPLAGAMVPAAARAIDSRDKKILVPAATSLLALAITLLPPPEDNLVTPVYHWAMLTTLYEDQGNDVAALESFNRALLVDHNRIGPEAWIKGADAKAHLNDPAGALQMLEEAKKLYPNDASLSYNYGRYKLDAGDYAAAFEQFNKAIAQMPTFTASYRGLAVVYDQLGEHQKAITAASAGLAIVPNDPSLLEVLGQLHAEE